MPSENNLYLQNQDCFSEKEFIAPGAKYLPVYGWEWSGEVSRAETDKQLLEMQRLGIKAMYIIPLPKTFRPGRIPTMMEPDYLTTAYMEEYRYAIDKAKELGMTCWFYDEGGWPSGGACGKVLMKHPKLAQKVLACRTFSLVKGETYHAAADALGAFFGSGEMVADGDKLTSGAEITEYYIETKFSEQPGVLGVPDLTRSASTDAFLEITHEAYKPHLKEHFGRTIQAVFCDEPAMPMPAFRAEIEELFEKENGYSIRPFLPELLGKRTLTKAGAKARITWFDLTSRLFCKNYLLREKAWANAHGMAFTGHVDRDDKAVGWHFGTMPVMRCLRCLDMPGIDVIWRQIFPAEKPTPFDPDAGVTCENRIFPRYASSAASQIGVRRVMTESLGVFGAGLTFDEMRYVLNFQAVRGVNVYNLLLIPYAREGFLMTGELPFFTEKHACYADLAPFNRYLERLSYVTTIGKNVSHTAIYMPYRDFCAGEETQKRGNAFEEIAAALENEYIPFDVFDDDVLEAADPTALLHGEICMGEARYKALVIPPCDYMPAESVRKLECFIDGGGRVFMLVDKSLTTIRGAKVVERVKNSIAPPLKLSGDTERIRIGERHAENGKLFLFNNESLSTKTFTVAINENAYLLNLENGRIMAPERDGERIKMTLLKGQMACLWISNEACKTEGFSKYGNEMLLDTPFTFRKTSRFKIGEMAYETETYSEHAKPIALGDWSGTVGVDFSGSGIYEASFAAPETAGRVLLDLGEVHYTCEVFLNGNSLGVRVMPPYSYVMERDALRPENKLEIRVTNTPANAYNYTNSFDKWPQWMLTGYWKREKLFQQDALSGGLYGPVTLKY